MAYFVINGGRKLKGGIPVYGSKNAAMPLMAATLLTDQEVRLYNMPGISDVSSMAAILRSMGAEVESVDHNITVRAREVDGTKAAGAAIGALRGSVLFFGALLGRCRQASLPKPGGDLIGARPIDVHLDAFEQLGAKVTHEDQRISIDGTGMKPAEIVLSELSVTATENVMLAAATLPGKTVIQIAAAEPHVVALADLLNSMGAKIGGAGTHTVVVEGREKLMGADFENIQDMLEAGTFILMAAATASSISVEKVPLEHMRLFFKKIDDIGIRYKVTQEKGGLGNVAVEPGRMRGFNVQTLPYPGIATDLQSPFAVVATQAAGHSLIHDPMYEGRFKYISELQKMGADAVICDPHRVVINGPTKLVGRRIPGLDVRSGATLLVAGLAAEGETIVDQAEHIDRGYFNLMERLQSLGADIKRG